MKIGIDLDDILGKTLSKLIEFLEKEKKITLSDKDFYYTDWKKALNMPKEKAIEILYEFLKSKYFENLETEKWAVESIKKLNKKHTLFVITARQYFLKEITEKWINKNFSETFEKIFLCDNHYDFKSPKAIEKGDVCIENSISILIDDDPNHAIYALKKGIRVIMMEKPWNISFTSEEIIKVKNWKEVLKAIKKIEKTEKITKIIEKLRSSKPETMLSKINKDDDSAKTYKILISTILSARSKDETTHKISKELFKKYPTIQKLAKANRKEVEKIIKKIGFYRNKSKNIISTAREIIKKHNGKVPDTIEELINLPGVGRKTAGCVLVYGFKKNAIPVDTHVHRITNRIGLVKTKKPEETEKELMEITPKELWQEINERFVSYGKKTCKPIKPECSKCIIKEYCIKQIIRKKNTQKKKIKTTKKNKQNPNKNTQKKNNKSKQQKNKQTEPEQRNIIITKKHNQNKETEKKGGKKMEELLFMEDSYKKEFNAEITETKEGKYVILNKTAFYPNGGGQPSDTGTIIRENDKKEFKVVFTKKNEGIIFHQIEPENELKQGDKIKGIIDWERRYKLMRMHTAAHLLSAVFHKESGALITGNQLDIDKSRIDFSLEEYDKEKIEEYIEKANAIINEDRKIRIYSMEREEAQNHPELFKLAKTLPETIKTLRIVEIEGIDKQADGGTHVNSTKEIGKIELIKCENKGKSNRRLYFSIS